MSTNACVLQVVTGAPAAGRYVQFQRRDDGYSIARFTETRGAASVVCPRTAGLLFSDETGQHIITYEPSSAAGSIFNNVEAAPEVTQLACSVAEPAGDFTCTAGTYTTFGTSAYEGALLMGLPGTDYAFLYDGNTATLRCLAP